MKRRIREFTGYGHLREPSRENSYLFIIFRNPEPLEYDVVHDIISFKAFKRLSGSWVMNKSIKLVMESEMVSEHTVFSFRQRLDLLKSPRI